MYTLFKVNINWGAYMVCAIMILLLFPSLSWYSYFALLIALHQFFLLFFSINSVIPIRYLLGSFMCLQMFIGPVLAYNGLDKYQYFMYQMKVPEAVYFSYALPAVILFILGLHINAKKLDGEVPDVKKIAEFTTQHPKLAYWLIGIGFGSSLVGGFFGSELSFVFYLLGSAKFVGVFLLILGNKKLKLIPLIIIYGSIILSSLGAGMFHDLLTWLIMLGSVLAIKFKPGINIKLGALFSFILLVIVIQQLKGVYRMAIGKGDRGDVETFTNVFEETQGSGGVFNLQSIAASNVRINQGFIITNIMLTVPDKVPYANGAELMQLLEAAFLPRLIAPNKLKAGDRTIFMKYSGMRIKRGTSMGLSSLGDAYVNFGTFGGAIFMFILGFIYSEVLNVFHKKSKDYPVLILFTTLVFYYPIRPDCELQTILGHLVKSCFLIYIVLIVWQKEFRLWPASMWKKSLS